MDGLFLFPGILSNDRINKSFLDQVIFPIGKTISILQTAQLLPLLKNELAVGRAIGAVALSYRYVLNEDVSQSFLCFVANDRRSEVRDSIGLTLARLVGYSPERIFKLSKKWMIHTSPRIQVTALKLIPNLFQYYEKEIMLLLQSFVKDKDQIVQDELVHTLEKIAKIGYSDSVIDLLLKWSNDMDHDGWVICRTLSASWVLNYPDEVETILKKIQGKNQLTGLINKTMKILRNHGLEVDL
jgi:hypothetical protein